MSETTSESTDGRARRAANLFDLRRVIGGLFVAYGLLLAVLGVFDSDAEIDRAAGVNINLYGGLVMLTFGLLMLLWAFRRPLGEELEEESDEGGRAPRGNGNGARGRGDAGRE